MRTITYVSGRAVDGTGLQNQRTVNVPQGFESSLTCMKNVVILDLDGVMITTPSWKADNIHQDGFSMFNESASECLDKLSNVNAELWLISDRRKGYTLEQLNTFFKNRNIKIKLSGLVPVYGNVSRIVELFKFLKEESPENYLIIDDDSSLDGLEDKSFWIKTQPLIGFNEEKLNEALKKIKHWK